MANRDDKSKAPSFYEAAAAMGGGAGKGGPAGGGAGAGANAAGAAGAGEKVQNVKALLEVFKKMDKLESDPVAKDIIQQMSSLAQKYMDTVQGGGAPGTPPPSATSDGAAGGGESAPGGGAGGAGGGMGGGAGAPAPGPAVPA